MTFYGTLGPETGKRLGGSQKPTALLEAVRGNPAASGKVSVREPLGSTRPVRGAKPEEAGAEAGYS